MKRREFLAATGVGTAGLVLPLPVFGKEPYRVEIYLAHEYEYASKHSEVTKVAAIDRMTLPEGFGDNMVPYKAPNPGSGQIDRIRFDIRKLAGLKYPLLLFGSDDKHIGIRHFLYPGSPEEPQIWGEWNLVIDQWSEPSYHLHLEHMKLASVTKIDFVDDFMVAEGVRFTYNGYRWAYFTKDSSYIDQRSGRIEWPKT